jgi:hypothetical protein
MATPLREVFPVRHAGVIVHVVRWKGRATGQQQDHGK